MDAAVSSVERTGFAGWAATAVIVAAVVALGGWGLSAPRGEHDSTAAIGKNVSIPGGFARVEQVRDESMGGMAMSGPGMRMKMTSAPGTALPDPPKGFRRVSVVVTLVSKSAPGLHFGRREFRIGPVGSRGVEPVGIDSGPDVVPVGMAASRSLAFDVPEKARNLVLTVKGSQQPMRLGGGPAAAHEHGDHEQDHADKAPPKKAHRHGSHH